jgi:biopolymer transport protein ExbD
MKYSLEVCVIATLAVAPSVAAQSAVTASKNSDADLKVVHRITLAESGIQAMQKGISVELPVTSNARPIPAADNEDAWIVTVTADGRIYFGTDPVTPAGLEDAMKSRPRNREQKLYIKADARVPFANLEQVIEAGRVVAFEAPVLLTSQPEPSAFGTVVPPKGLEVLVGPALPAGTVATVVQLLNSEQQPPILKINNEQIPWPALQSTLTQLLQNRSEKLVLLRANGQLPFGRVVEVIDTCRATEAKVVLATQKL